MRLSLLRQGNQRMRALGILMDFRLTTEASDFNSRVGWGLRHWPSCDPVLPCVVVSGSKVSSRAPLPQARCQSLTHSGKKRRFDSPSEKAQDARRNPANCYTGPKSNLGKMGWPVWV